MKTIKYFSLLALLFSFTACTTLSTETEEASGLQVSVPVKPFTVENAIEEIESGVTAIENLLLANTRDIDNEEWLTLQVNLFASRDLYIIEKITTALKYSVWSDSEKKEFIEYFINPLFSPDNESSSALLQSKRIEILQEMSYLVQYSTLLSDIPWMMRSRFNEKSEFSYWYIMYICKNIDPLWVDSKILPGMLQLIPVDEITPVTYLWLKNPSSLDGMEQEILLSGYPWTNLTDIIRINGELIKLIEELYKSDEVKPGQYREGALI